MRFKIDDILNKVDNHGNLISNDSGVLKFKVMDVYLKGPHIKYKIFNYQQSKIQYIATEGREIYKYTGKFVLSKESKRNNSINELID